MPTVATTSPDDVSRYIDTDLSGPEVEQFINDAEDEALTYNDADDFEDGELDRLVKFYTVLLIDNVVNRGGEMKRLKQGARSVSLSTSGDDGQNFTGWIRSRVRANDPSGQLLGGRNSNRFVSVTSRDDHYLDDEDMIGDGLVGEEGEQ